jgi:hypothetical protein
MKFSYELGLGFAAWCKALDFGQNEWLLSVVLSESMNNRRRRETRRMSASGDFIRFQHGMQRGNHE